MIFSLANAVVDDPDEVPEIGKVRWSSDLKVSELAEYTSKLVVKLRIVR